MSTSTIQFAAGTSFFAPLVASVKNLLANAMSAPAPARHPAAGVADESPSVWDLYRLAGSGDSVNARVADALAKRAQA